MISNRRQWLRTGLKTAALAAAVPLLPLSARAARPARILVGFPAGGGTDALARLLAHQLQPALGRPVVVENRPGAGGQIAANVLKMAVPDGNTVLLSHDHTICIVPHVMKNPGFDPQVDFRPLAGVSTFANAFAVTASHPARSYTEYMEWAGGQPATQLLMGVPAPASTLEFMVGLLARKYDLPLQAVPYRGTAPMLADLMGGQIPAGFASLPELIELHHAGRLRVLGVTGAQRQQALPEVPTFGESGVPGYEELPFYGFFAGSGVSREVAAQWQQAIGETLERTAVREQMPRWAMERNFMTGPRLQDVAAAYSRTWSRNIAQLGYQPQ